MGTLSLLQAAKLIWDGNPNKLFYHVSTDEVYGSLGDEGFFTELSKYDLIHLILHPKPHQIIL